MAEPRNDDESIAYELPGSSVIEGGRAWIGTSGWSYAHWRRDFYVNVPDHGWLSWCAGRFTALEINATHYRLQRRATFEAWRAAVPRDFRFAVKAHRYLTHTRLLAEPVDPIRRERDRAQGLGSSLGAVLWQLPPRFVRDDSRLETFAAALVSEWPTRHAIEFRHTSWFCEDVALRLRRFGIAVCISHSGRWPMWEEETAGFVYLRLHGAPRTYSSVYGPEGLRSWVERIDGWLRAGLDVYAFFDNDAAGGAPHDAELLLAAIGVHPRSAARSL